MYPILEDFSSYSLGTLNGSNGGTGWLSGWVNGGGSTDVSTISPALPGYTKVAFGNAGGGNASSRSFASTISITSNFKTFRTEFYTPGSEFLMSVKAGANILSIGYSSAFNRIQVSATGTPASNINAGGGAGTWTTVELKIGVSGGFYTISGRYKNSTDPDSSFSAWSSDIVTTISSATPLDGISLGLNNSIGGSRVTGMQLGATLIIPLAEENFDGFTNGQDIQSVAGGGTGWSGNWFSTGTGTFTATNTQFVSAPNGATMSISAPGQYKRIHPTINGDFAYSWNVRFADFTNQKTVQIDSAGSVALDCGNLTGSNNIVLRGFVSGSSVTLLTGASANTWYTIEIQGNTNSNLVQGRVNGGAWSNFILFGGFAAYPAANPVGRVILNSTATNDVYFDNIKVYGNTISGAIPEATEYFDSYSNAAALNTLNGGTGWNGAWSTGNTFTITNTQFDTSPNSLLFPNTAGAEATRDFAAVGTPYTSDVSVKFWVRLATTSSEFTLRIRDAVFIQNFGISFQNTTFDVVGITPAGITPAFSGVTWVPNTWYEVIMKYNRTTGQYSWQVDSSAVTTVTGATGRNYFRLSVLADDGLAGVYLDTIETYTSLIENNSLVVASSANSLMFSGGI